ncbi:uncharacterized protein LOC143225735 isoform X2 [Tachypleus tridentatus]|uniref:uncharacterized protein LOC143225735 isoform X2 n=1 Tax=Tachypleus tridentatus TaxID=6853 RepID=UPI003FD49BCA
MVVPVSDLSISGVNGTGFRQVHLQQSVTMLAYIDQTAGNITEMPQVVHKWHLDKKFTIFVGAAIGALGLCVVLVVAVLVWNCCYQRTLRQKFSLTEEKEPKCVRESESGMVQSESVVFLGGDSTQQCLTHVIESDKLFELSSPEDTEKESVIGRPRSRPLQLSPVHLDKFQLYPEKDTETSSTRGSTSRALSRIPEINIHGHKHLSDLPNFGECTSYEVLNNPKHFNRLRVVNQEVTMKTRSLPLWGRSKVTLDDDGRSELFSGMNFSKKRKNRMRNDSAAAIALNRSMTSFPQLKHQDTESLVDNETVVVYNERTAL